MKTLRVLLVGLIVVLLLAGCSSTTVSGTVLEKLPDLNGAGYAFLADVDGATVELFVSGEIYASLGVGDRFTLSCTEKVFVVECE